VVSKVLGGQVLLMMPREENEEAGANMAATAATGRQTDRHI